MKNILITGGTIFVSRYIAEYYVNKGYNVSVLNRGFHAQPKGTTLLKTDRLLLGDQLENYQFDQPAKNQN